jgi:hypothetical protein
VIYETFKQWLAAVDDKLVAKSGLGVRDLADQPYHDWYDDDMSPTEAAEQVLEDEGFPR